MKLSFSFFKSIFLVSIIFIILILFTFIKPKFFNKKTSEEFLQETITLKLPNHIKNKNDISCLIADLKYDGNSVKILELGNIIFSNLPSHEFLWGDFVIWKRFYEYVNKLDIPLWCVGTITNPKRASYTAFERLTNLGATKYKDIAHLVHDPDFRKLFIKNENAKYAKLEDYNAILACSKYSDLKYRGITENMPGFLFLNDVVHAYANDKQKLATLCDDHILSSFRPQWKSYSKKYSKELVDRIKRDFDSDILVIKPTISTVGRGVIIVNKNNLKKTLKTILTKKDAIKKMDDRSFSYWAKDGGDTFLVESFEHSKQITVDQKEYDPKMRIIFILSCNNRVVTLKFIGSYWLSPKHSLDTQSSLNNKHKSSMNGHRIKVSQKDTKHVQEILSSVLPTMYIKMIESS